MRNLLTILILISSLCLFTWFSPSLIHAQSAYEQLLQEYLNTVDVYNRDRDVYLEKRAEYIRYQTLASQTAAIEATQKFMISRQQTMIPYLKMMKGRLEQSPEITEQESKPLLVFIEEEIGWLEDQMPLFDTADDLDDLVKLNTATKSRHGEFLVNSFKMKALFDLSKVRLNRKATVDLIRLTSEQASRIRGEGQVDVTNIDRWLIEANERIVLSESKEQEAIVNFSKIRSSSTRKNLDSQFGRFRITLQQSNQYIKEAKDYLQEIIQDIRFD